MTLHDDVCRIACTLCPTLSEEQTAVLSTLCSAAEGELRQNLRSGIEPEDCRDSFCCAAAWLALERFAAGADSDGISGFTVGNVSVNRSGGTELRRQALQMMAPYLLPNAVLLGVRG